jgi:hypothetical protein
MCRLDPIFIFEQVCSPFFFWRKSGPKDARVRRTPHSLGRVWAHSFCIQSLCCVAMIVTTLLCAVLAWHLSFSKLTVIANHPTPTLRLLGLLFLATDVELAVCPSGDVQEKNDELVWCVCLPLFVLSKRTLCPDPQALCLCPIV